MNISVPDSHASMMPDTKKLNMPAFETGGCAAVNPLPHGTLRGFPETGVATRRPNPAGTNGYHIGL
jgi:hypothetical protein